MKFMVEFQLQPGIKNKAVEAFEQRGPNRNPGVRFVGAWVGTKDDVAFVLVESADEALVAKAGQSWSDFSQHQIYPVIDVQQF